MARFKRLGLKTSVSLTALIVAGYGLGVSAFAQEDPVDNLETVVVSGYRASLATAIEMRRNETAAVDSIVSEDIGKFPDANLAEAMQRIPGVTLSRTDGGEGRNISVRGLGPQFTRVRLNGMEGASQTGSSDIYGAINSGRSFDFNVFPTEIFSSLSARKTPSPDVEEGSLGATVDLATPKPLDMHEDFVFTATARNTYQEVGEYNNPRVSMLVAKKLMDGKLGVLATFSYQHRKTLEVGYSAVDILEDDANGGFCSPIGWTGTQNPSDSTTKGTTSTMCSTNNPRTGSIAAYTLLEDNDVFMPRIPRYTNSQSTSDRVGATLTLQWIPEDNTELALNVIFSRYGQRRYDSHIAALSFGRTATNNGQPMTSVVDLEITGKGSILYGEFDGVDIRSENLDDRFSSSVKQVNLQATHNFTDKLTVDGYIGYSENVYDMPYRMQTAIDAIDTDGFIMDFVGSNGKRKTFPTLTFGIDVSDPTNFTYGATDSDGTVHGLWSMQGKPARHTSVNEKLELNVGYEVMKGLKLKVGGSYRINNYGSWSLSVIPSEDDYVDLPDGVTLSNIVRHVKGSNKYWDGAPADWVQIDQKKLKKVMGINDILYCGTACGAGLDNIRERIGSGYAMADFDVDVYGFTIRGDIGARYVHTGEYAMGYIATSASDEYEEATGYSTTSVRNSVTTSYNDFLPSANIVVDISDDLLARFSVAKVMSRPELSYLIPSSSVNATTRTGTINNPYLKPIRADTLDIGIEWYFNPEAMFTVSYFHKDLKSYIQKLTGYEAYSNLGLPESLLEDSASTVDDQFYVTRYENTSGGPLNGVELDIVMPMSFLPGFWQYFGIQANYTYVKSSIDYILDSDNGVATETTTNDLLMLSPHSASAVLYWEDDKFSARLTGSYRSDYIRAIPASDGSDLQGNHATIYLDMSASYNIDEKIKVIFEIQNLTDEMSVLYIDSSRKDTLYGMHDGRTFSLGFSLKI